MKTLNVKYSDDKSLRRFIDEHKFIDASQILIQLFSGVCDKEFLNTLIATIIKELPDAKLIGSTTDGEIIDGKIDANSTIISFSTFENTQVKTYAIPLEKDSYSTAQTFANKIQNIKNSKCLISFVSGLRVNGEEYLQAFRDELPQLTIAGGLAGDNATFTQTYIFTEKGVAQNGAVGALLVSENLHVNTHYNFSWENIGKLLTITKSEKNRVYEIDGRSAENIYREYLGDEVGNMLPATGIEFPLMIKRGSLNIARAVLQKHEDGSLSFAGNVEEGSKVQFGYGNIESILNESPKKLQDIVKSPIESIFVFSCMARKRLLGEGIVAELQPLSKIAPLSGFFTYGEFFHTQGSGNELLNQTMTLLSLSETKELYDTTKLDKQVLKPTESHTVTALSHLISITSRELQELNEELEDKVNLKTLELKQLNNELEKKIKEETKKVQQQYKILTEAQKSMIENEKYASLGTLVAGVAHEINTPVGLSLTGITHILSEMKKLNTAFNSGEMTESDFTTFVDNTSLLAESINTNLVKAAHLVKSFKQVAVDQSSEEERVFNLKEYTDEVLLSLHSKTKLTNISIKVDIDKDINILSNPGAFSQILTNLIMNSIQHAFEENEEGTISIKMFTQKNNIAIVYNDNGKGMSQEIQKKVFDPFFTTDRANGGSGLGMNIIHNIVTRNLKGKIVLLSQEGNGATFTLVIPDVYKQ